MWGKTIEPEAGLNQVPAAPPVAAPPRKIAAVIARVGQTMQIKGDITSGEELVLDGDIQGSIEVRDRLTIGPNGKIKADVKANEIVVQGSIQGDVEAVGRISIMTGASIVGDVKTAGIVIEDGAYFKGGIDIVHPENKMAEEPRPVAAGAGR